MLSAATFRAPERRPDAARVAIVEQLAAELRALAKPLGIKREGSESIGDAAHREAWAIQRREGFTPRLRTLFQISNANAAIHRAREVAEGGRSTVTWPSLLAEARDEMRQAREAIEALRMPVAAE